MLDWLPACVAHDFCNPEDPDALGDDSSFFRCDQQLCLAFVRRVLRCKLACMLPPSALDPGLASGDTKDEGRDRFIGGDSSIGGAHLSYYSRDSDAWSWGNQRRYSSIRDEWISSLLTEWASRKILQSRKERDNDRKLNIALLYRTSPVWVGSMWIHIFSTT